MARIPSRLAEAIRQKYQVRDNTFIREAKADVRDRLEVEIGDEKQPSTFYPQVKLKRWDNEINLSVRLKDDDYDAPTIQTSQDKIKWISGKREAHFYEIGASQDHPEGGYEFEVVLKEKPATNVVEFSIQTKGLEFLYQPALTPEEIERGCARPENVVGSYAAYYKDCPANYEGGKLYRVGKAFHIYRPKIEDANGNWTWGELRVDEEQGTLAVTIPWEFLDEAVYPVVVDPTFGYTSCGASSAGISNPGDYLLGRYTCPSDYSSASKITAWLKKVYSEEVPFRAGIWKASDNSTITNGLGSPSGNVTATSFTEYDSTFSSSPSMSGSTDYWLGATANGGGATCNIAYDSGWTSDYGMTSATYDWSGYMDLDTYFTSTNSHRYSLYCTYTASGATNVTVNASVQTATLSLPIPTVTAVSPAVYFYNAFKKNVANGGIDLNTDTIKVMLVSSSYTFNQDSHEFKSDIANEITGTGYTAGGVALANKTVTVDNANNLAYFDADDAAWSATTLTFRGAVIYKDTGNAATSPLICFLDFASDQSTDNQNLTLQWPAGGILKLT